MTPPAACRVLIPFAKPDLYGLERTVIETFDALRPDVIPQFVEAESVAKKRLPIVDELDRRRLSYALLPDGDGWPRVRRRKWDGKARQMALALLKGNAYYARALGNSDAVYMDGTYTAVFTVAAATRCRLTGKPVIHHFHEWPPGSISRLLNGLTTDYFHNTAGGRNAALQVDPHLARKRHWITPPIVEIADGAPSPIAANGKKNVVFAGQVSLHKGVDLLIDAFRTIARHHPDAMLHIVGGSQPAFESEFRSMCERAALGEQLKCWGFRADATAFFRQACLSVQSTPPSRYRESFGRTVVEAMAFGVPTVCFGSGALSEIVTHGETGLVCAESSEALAAGIDRFLADPALRDQCGHRALHAYRDRFAPDVVRAQWLTALRAIAPSRGGGSES